MLENEGATASETTGEATAEAVTEPVADQTATTTPVTEAHTEVAPKAEDAFAKRLGAAVAKKERELRATIEAEYAKKAQAAPQTPPAVPADDAAELEAINEELRQEFYDNPLQAMQKANEILAGRKEARAQAEQAQWNWHADKGRKTHEDWDQMTPKMQELLKAHPDLAEKPEHLERVYQLAKRGTGPDHDSLLKDETFLTKAQEHLLTNKRDAIKESLRAEIINEYVSGKKSAAADAPPIMGGSPGGSAPAMPPATPKSWADAKRAAMSR